MSSLRAVLAQAIYDAPNGIDGDQLADMLLEDPVRITGKTPEECRTQIMAVCQCVADAALAAIEASGTHVVVPTDPTEKMLVAIDTEDDRLPITVEETWNLYHSMIAARPRDAAPTEGK